MSERGSFTTEYIYNESDYKIIRKALDKNSKYLCVSPPAYWGDSKNELPIVSGKVGSLNFGLEWSMIAFALVGVETEHDIKIVVMQDAGNILLISKRNDGYVFVRELNIGEDVYIMK